MTTNARYYQTVHESRPAMDYRAMLTQAAFGLALAMVVARCMLQEVIRDPFEIFVGSAAIPRGPGADTSVWLDLLCCLPALIVLVRRCWDKTYTIRWSWGQLLIFPLAGWMALSVRWADDKFLDLVSTSNFIAAAALFWAMSQLVRSWMRLRIVAAIAFGLLLVLLVRGFYYKFLDMPMMLEHPSTLVQQQGLDPNSFSGIQFQKKFSELMGFNSSPNSFAGLIVLLMTVGVGAAIQRIKDRDDPAWTVAIALFAPLSIWLLIYTQSKAALVMPVLVAALFAILWKWRGAIARQSKRWFWIGVGIIALSLAAVVGHGLVHHGLPTSSLNFRWRYWSAAMRMFERHPVRGFGWENFGPHYLRDRLPAASEEIRDPHDFIVRFFVELGAVGGVLMLAWFGRLWWELTRPIAPPAEVSPLSRNPKFGQIFFVAGIALAAVAINIAASLDFSQKTSWLLVELVNRLLYLCALILGSLVVGLRSFEKPQLDERAAPWVLYGILVAVGVFLIHNLIEFSLFEAGSLCLFGLLVGSALGIRIGNPPVRKPRIPRGAIAALVVAGGIWLSAVYFIAIPTARAETAAHIGDDQLRTGHYEPASDEYAYAAQLLPFNADYAFRAGRALHLSVGPPQPLADAAQIDRAVHLRKQIISWYSVAIARNPVFLQAYQLRAIFFMQTQDSDRMIADFDKVMELNPNDVSLRVEYAHDLEKLLLMIEAKKQLKLALDYNDQLDPAEPKRLSPQDEQALRAEMNSMPGN